MSSYHTGWAWQQTAGKAKLLLVALADFADDRGVTRTPIEVLAEKVELHRSTVIRQLESLASQGLIERIEQTAHTGHQQVSVTRLLVNPRVTARPETSISRGSQNATRHDESRKTSISGPSQNATRQSGGPETSISRGSQNATRQDAPENRNGKTSISGPSQNATHIYKNNSLLKTISNINNTTAEAVTAVVDAGLEDLAGEWIACQPNVQPPALAAQFRAWAGWIAGGLTAALQTEAGEVILLGSYAHPFAGLRTRMERHAKALQDSPGAPGPAAASEAACKPGERRVDPDGFAWTVESVQYGVVIFEEIHAPIDRPVALVGTWPLAALEASA